MKYFSMVAGLVLLANVASAATAPIGPTSVVRTLIDESRWGTCMVQLTMSPGSAGLDCPSNWVSFSCSGDFLPKDLAYKMFEAAQMAQALDLQVLMVVDDARKHNGQCLATRIDVQ